MALSPGTRIGGYEITGLLGSGGMGEVYRARDPRLNRDVALKVLLPAVANDADRLARFAREAQVLASLNHTNIAQVFGLEEGDASADAGQARIRALVMELVEGPTLADRLAHGAIPLEDAVAIAIQIAQALEAAHDQGIIHRDLKPANIKVREDGAVKVLDFGLAKAIDPAASSVGAPVTQTPTITTPAMTQAGVILGTAAYMSPEQAKGRAVDKRSDVWAFGAVLYEMLTGTPPFDGEDMADVLGAVVRLEPDWSRLPAHTPPLVRALVQGCLVKDRRHRVGDVAAALFALRSAAAASPREPVPISTSARRPWRVAAGSAIVGGLGVAIVLAALLRAGMLTSGEAPAGPVRFTILPPKGTDIVGGAALSPDGRHVVFEATDRSLWIRTLDQAATRRLEGTQGGVQPFWSPDSRHIGFFAGGKLKRMDVAAGAVLTVCDVSNTPAGGTWGPDGTILFSASAVTSPILKVNAAGGTPVAVTTLDPAPGRLGHVRPTFLPDGRHFFYRQFAPALVTTRIGSVDGSLDREFGVAGDSNPVYAEPGTLLFVRGTTLFQQRLDPARLVVVGDPAPVAEGVATAAGNTGLVAASRTGSLAYVAEVATELRRAMWVDRQGRVEPVTLQPGTYGDPALSPDGRQMALSVDDASGRNLWVFDLERGTFGKRTFEGTHEFPLWSKDGQHLVFSTNFMRGPLMTARADGTGKPEPLISDERRPGQKVASSWSADGTLLAFQSGQDVYVREPDGSTHPAVATVALEREGRFAPTGSWLAYSSDETGRREVYVQSYPPGQGKWQISTAGGAQPMWSARGDELFYKSGNRLMVVPVEAGAAFKPGTPRVLFEFPMPERTPGDPARFAVSPDAKRFMVLTNTNTDSAEARPTIHVILNWRAMAGAPTAP